MADPFAPRTMKRKNVKGLALNSNAPPRSFSGQQVPEDDGRLEIGIEYRLDLKQDDLEVVKELGSGNGGTVSKVRHKESGLLMARKVIHVEAKREMRKRIVRELQIMHGCSSEYIVMFYGAFLNSNNDVIMCMEYMDFGSLDRVTKVFGPVRIDVLGKIAVATLGGLTYLYQNHHIMHRDIKPSNILINSKGDIRLCDFGVSGELINSIADTFVGTSTYMAPERIQGDKYTVKSDVWSFGLTIMELAIGSFPFVPAAKANEAGEPGEPEEPEEEEEEEDGKGPRPLGILDLLQRIVHEPPPTLPESDAFPSILTNMISLCMAKLPENRPTPQALLERDSFIQAAKRTPVDVAAWAISMMNRDNRKSHLLHSGAPSLRELYEAEQAERNRMGPAQIIARRQPRAEIQRLLTKMSTRRPAPRPAAVADTSSVKTPVAAHPPPSARRIVSPQPSPSYSDSSSGPSTATAATFSLPVRSGPPGGPLPTPPAYPVSDDMRSDRSARSDRTERAERPRQSDRSNRSERSDRTDRTERPAVRQMQYGIPANPSPSSRY